MAVLVIGGMPGCGKTTLAINVARDMGLEEVVQTDVLKTVLKATGRHDASVDTSHNAWRRLGEEKSPSALKTGYRLHTDAYQNLLQDIVTISTGMGKALVLEGAQISPFNFATLEGRKLGYYITCPPEERRRRLALKQAKRSCENPEWVAHFDDICFLDEWLCAEAWRSGMAVVENTSLEQTLEQIEKEALALWT